MRSQIEHLACAAGAISSLSDNTALVSPIVDVRGFDSLTFFILTGTLADADATFAVLMEESDDSGLSGSNAVADADMIGQDVASAVVPETQAAFTFALDGGVRRIGYKGTKRYVRLTVTPSNNSGAAPMAICPIKGRPERAP